MKVALKKFIFAAMAAILTFAVSAAYAEANVRCVTAMNLAGMENPPCTIEYTDDAIIVTFDEGDVINKEIYDYEGRIQERAYIENGVLNYTEYYSYNANGDLILVNTIDEEGYEVYADVYTYDDRGRLVLYELKLLSNGKVDNGDEYTYGENGALLRESHFGRDGNITSYTSYESDANGVILRGTEYEIDDSGKESVSGYWDYSYDDKGNLTGKVWSNHNPYETSALMSDIYEYDESGRKIAYKSYGLDPEELYFDVVYTYDADGYLISVLDRADEFEIIPVYETLYLDDSIAEKAENWSRSLFLQRLTGY